MLLPSVLPQSLEQNRFQEPYPHEFFLEKPSPADDLHPVTARSPGKGWLSGHPILHSSWSCRLETETWQHLGGWGCLLSFAFQSGYNTCEQQKGLFFALLLKRRWIVCSQKLSGASFPQISQTCRSVLKADLFQAISSLSVAHSRHFGRPQITFKFN